MLQLPLVVLLHEDGADEADDGRLVREDADDIGPALHFLVQALQWVGGVKLGTVLGRERQVGEHIVLALVHQVGEFGPARSELIGDLTPDLSGGRLVGLQEGLAQGGGDDGVLAFRHMGQGVAHPVDSAALPGRAQYPGDRLLEALVGIGDDQLHALEATADQGLEEAGPKGFRFGRADLKPDDLTPAVGVDRDGDYRRHRDDPPALALLEIGGVQPEIGPFAFQGPLQEGLHPLVDVLAELGDLRLRDAGEPHEEARAGRGAWTSSSTRRVDTPPIQAS